MRVLVGDGLFWPALLTVSILAISPLAFACSNEKQGLQSMNETSASANWARDPKIAVKEEYEAAVQEGTCAAFELFLARHPEPENEFADDVRERIQKLNCNT